jgi:hypothetical protein
MSGLAARSFLPSYSSITVVNVLIRYKIEAEFQYRQLPAHSSRRKSFFCFYDVVEANLWPAEKDQGVGVLVVWCRLTRREAAINDAR